MQKRWSALCRSLGTPRNPSLFLSARIFCSRGKVCTVLLYNIEPTRASIVCRLPERTVSLARYTQREREFFIDNLLVRIHFIIVMIRWTGLAPWDFEFPFPGSLTSTFLVKRWSARCRSRGIPTPLHSSENPFFCFFFTLVAGPRRSLRLKLSDTRVYEPQLRARLGTRSARCRSLGIPTPLENLYTLDKTLTLFRTPSHS